MRREVAGIIHTLVFSSLQRSEYRPATSCTSNMCVSSVDAVSLPRRCQNITAQGRPVSGARTKAIHCRHSDILTHWPEHWLHGWIRSARSCHSPAYGRGAGGLMDRCGGVENCDTMRQSGARQVECSGLELVQDSCFDFRGRLLTPHTHMPLGRRLLSASRRMQNLCCTGVGPRR